MMLAIGFIIEKYALAFSAIYCAEASSKDNFKGSTTQIPSVFDEKQIFAMTKIWKMICTIQLKDPFREVSLTAKEIIDFIKGFLEPYSTTACDKDNSFTENTVSELKLNRSPHKNAENSDMYNDGGKGSIRRNMSDYFSKWTSSGNAMDDRDVDQIESVNEDKDNSRKPSNLIDGFPASLFGWRKYFAFGEENSNMHDNDLLSQTGAIRAYRNKRNAVTHAHGRDLMDDFNDLHPNIQEKMKPHSSSYDFSGEPPEVVEYESRLYSKKQNLHMKECCQLRNDGASMTSLLRFHPYEPIIAACDDNDNLSIFDFEVRQSVLTLDQGERKCRRTSLRWINEQSNSLLLSGSDDGTIHIYGNVLPLDGYARSQRGLLATSFTAAPDIGADQGSGLVTEWQQFNNQLLVGGNSKYLRCWDLNTEKLIGTYENKSESCMTVVTSAWDPLVCAKDSHPPSIGPHIVCCGYGDGSMKVFDTRTQTSVTSTENSKRRKPRRMNYSEHKSWIVSMFFTGYGGSYEIASGCVAGRVKFWDLRYPHSRRTIDILRTQVTALAGHSRVPLIASGSQAQYIKYCTYDEDTIQVIRTDDHGPVSCLDFHPYRLLLAAGATDEVIHIYSAEK